MVVVLVVECGEWKLKEKRAGVRRRRARLRLGAGDYEDGFLMQIDVHIPLAVIVVEADDHVWQMAGLVGPW